MYTISGGKRQTVLLDFQDWDSSWKSWLNNYSSTNSTNRLVISTSLTHSLNRHRIYWIARKHGATVPSQSRHSSKCVILWNVYYNVMIILLTQTISFWHIIWRSIHRTSSERAFWMVQQQHVLFLYWTKKFTMTQKWATCLVCMGEKTTTKMTLLAVVFAFNWNELKFIDVL